MFNLNIFKDLIKQRLNIIDNSSDEIVFLKIYSIRDEKNVWIENDCNQIWEYNLNDITFWIILIYSQVAMDLSNQQIYNIMFCSFSKLGCHFWDCQFLYWTKNLAILKLYLYYLCKKIKSFTCIYLFSFWSFKVHQNQ